MASRTSLDSSVSVLSNTSSVHPHGLQAKSPTSELSKVPTRSSIAQTINSVRDTIGDDIIASQRKPETLEEMLRSKIEMEDVMRMHTAQQPEDLDLISKVFTNKEGDLDLPPEGGYGWVSCLCATMMLINSWGLNTSFGVYLSFYLNHDTFAGARHTDYALIAGLSTTLGQAGVPLANIVMRMLGFRSCLFIGVVLECGGLILASFAKKLWQLYLTQGVLFGLGIPFIVSPATSVIPGWFLKKRGFAIGIMLSGTGLGGVVYSLLAQGLIARTGNQRWALRASGIMAAGLLSVSIALIRRYKPAPRDGVSLAALKRNVAISFSGSIVKLYSVNMILIWLLFSFFAYNLMVLSLAAYAVSRGLTAAQGSAVTAILNGSQTVGRPMIGFVADRTGRINTCVVWSLVLVILNYGMWMQADNYVILAVFAAILGQFLGISNVMNTVLAADLVRPEDFVPVFGWLSMMSAPAALICEVVALAVVDKKLHNPYLHTQIMCGCFFIMALVMVLILREYIVRLFLKQRLNVSEEERDFDKADKYKHLLSMRPSKFFVRMFYPVKV